MDGGAYKCELELLNGHSLQLQRKVEGRDREFGHLGGIG